VNRDSLNWVQAVLAGQGVKVKAAKRG
jgi:hypothetical protein